MKTWYVGLDETGRFDPLIEDESSFVCAVVTQLNHRKLYQLYPKLAERLGKNCAAQDGEANKGTKLQFPLLREFHYAEDKKAHPAIDEGICKIFVPDIQKIVVSEGKPLILANPQGWWLSAVKTVLHAVLEQPFLSEGDSVQFYIDQRSEKVLGWIIGESSTGQPPIEKATEGKALPISKFFQQYHSFICGSLQNDLKRKYGDKYKIKVNFGSDTSIPAINLADLICGVVGKSKAQLPYQLIARAPCRNKIDIHSPETLRQLEPQLAAVALLSQVEDGDMRSIGEFGNILDCAAAPIYQDIWHSIVQFYEEAANSRGTHHNIIQNLHQLRENVLQKEMDKPRFASLSSEVKQQVYYNFLIVDTHMGLTSSPYASLYQTELRDGLQDAERLGAAWESHLQVVIRNTQLELNGYRFDDQVVDKLESAIEASQKIYHTIADQLFDAHEKTYLPDRTLASLYGSLGQVLAFRGEYDSARRNLYQSYYISRDSKAKPASYLVSVYHHLRDLEQCQKWFARQCDQPIADFGATMDKQSDSFFLLSYLRIRALELELHGRSGLPGLPEPLEKSNKEHYPWPLVLKWQAYALLKEGEQANHKQSKHKGKAKGLLAKAASACNKPSNEFTIRALALSIYQMLAMLEEEQPSEKYAQAYSQLYAELCEPSPAQSADFANGKKSARIATAHGSREEGFAAYVTQRMPWLAEYQTNEKYSLWQRAMSLPFYYA